MAVKMKRTSLTINKKRAWGSENHLLEGTHSITVAMQLIWIVLCESSLLLVCPCSEDVRAKHFAGAAASW